MGVRNPSLIDLQEEGVSVGQITALNFTGAGATATRSGTTGSVAVSGGGSSAQNPSLLVQAADYNLPADYGLVVPDFYEVGSGFVLDIAAGGMLDIV